MSTPFLRESSLFGVFLLTALAGCGETFIGSGGGAGGGAGGSSGSVSQGAGGTGGGVTATSSTSTGTPTPCDPLKADPCNECLADKCQPSYCGCIGDDDCLDLLGCIALGGVDPAFSWYEKCWQDSPTAPAKGGQLAVCAGKECVGCNVQPVNECLECEYLNCPDAINACFSDGECTGYLVCVAACEANMGGQECVSNCYDKHTAGVAHAQALGDCATGVCVEHCP